MSTRTLSLSLAAVLGATTLAREAAAAPPWVERSLTLPSGDFAFDVGLGIETRRRGRVPGGDQPRDGCRFDVNGSSLGVRTGLRFGDPDSRAATSPDGVRPTASILQTFGGGNAGRWRTRRSASGGRWCAARSGRSRSKAGWSCPSRRGRTWVSCSASRSPCIWATAYGSTRARTSRPSSDGPAIPCSRSAFRSRCGSRRLRASGSGPPQRL